MSDDIDPLLALKNAIRTKTRIEYPSNSTQLIISDRSFSKSTPTRYRKGSDFYSLEAVYLAWLLKDATGADYMKQAREYGLTVGFVSVTERKHVVDWLEGRSTDQDRVAPLTAAESTTPPGTPPRPTGQGLPITPRSSRADGQTALSSPSRRRHVPDAHDLEIVKKIRQNEVELQDRNTVLRGNKLNNFSAVRTAYGEKLKKIKETNRAAAGSTPTTPAADPKMLARKARHTQPIVMISSSPTALVTMHNVKKFLEDSTFEPSQEARARATAEGNLRPEDLIPIYRRRTTIDASGKETVIKSTYFVVDSVEALNKFGPDCWDRVVCVMTTGQAWQFRPYKWSEPRQLFHNVKGIYFTWSNDPPNLKIKDWNVTELKIDPHRRHVDKSVVAHFWKLLDTWIHANKPWIVKS